jgi:hypothetical protein
MDTDSVSSTASLSQDTRCAQLTPIKLMRHDAHEPLAATIDLTTPERTVETVEQRSSPEPNENHVPQLVQGQERDAVLAESNLQQRDSRLSILADEVRDPQPRGPQEKFKTHISKTLHVLTRTVPLSKTFRPVSVTRDIGVLERGYWQLVIGIAADDIVAEARRSPEKKIRYQRLSQELEASTLQERLRRYDGIQRQSADGSDRQAHDVSFWTEDEFLQFWETTSQFIKEGKLGWGVRLVKDSLDTCLWKVRLFTWGETVGHIWLVLWVLSEKLTGCVPMEWISGDGTVIVKMSGQKHSHGILGPWRRKGEEGERGVWGVG